MRNPRCLINQHIQTQGRCAPTLAWTAECRKGRDIFGAHGGNPHRSSPGLRGQGLSICQEAAHRPAELWWSASAQARQTVLKQTTTLAFFWNYDPLSCWGAESEWGPSGHEGAVGLLFPRWGTEGCEAVTEALRIHDCTGTFIPHISRWQWKLELLYKVLALCPSLLITSSTCWGQRGRGGRGGGLWSCRSSGTGLAAVTLVATWPFSPLISVGCFQTWEASWGPLMRKLKDSRHQTGCWYHALLSDTTRETLTSWQEMQLDLARPRCISSNMETRARMTQATASALIHRCWQTISRDKSAKQVSKWTWDLSEVAVATAWMWGPSDQDWRGPEEKEAAGTSQFWGDRLPWMALQTPGPLSVPQTSRRGWGAPQEQPGGGQSRPGHHSLPQEWWLICSRQWALHV